MGEYEKSMEQYKLAEVARQKLFEYFTAAGISTDGIVSEKEALAKRFRGLRYVLNVTEKPSPKSSRHCCWCGDYCK
jgi:hypothetical protein